MTLLSALGGGGGGSVEMGVGINMYLIKHLFPQYMPSAGALWRVQRTCFAIVLFCDPKETFESTL